jgi:tyrosine-protein phosphatase SIW14
MRYPAITVFQALLLALTCAPLQAGESSKTNNQDTPKAAVVRPDLPNFHEVQPFLYRSGEPSPAGLKNLKEMGVRTVIDLRAPSERHFDEEKLAGIIGLNYINLVMTSEPPTQKQVDTFISEVKKAKDNQAAGSVLVHCAHGSDRTGCMVGIWRVSQEGWNYEDAYAEMRKYWFTPKFTKLASAVKERAGRQ